MNCVSTCWRWCRKRCSQRMSHCGCVHLNMTENSGLLGEPLLLVPLREDEEGKGFLAHPHFQSLSMKGDCNDGNQKAALCSTQPWDYQNLRPRRHCWNRKSQR